jgi:hypothetical protein
MPTRSCAFVGPTRLQSIPAGVHIFAPAALGSIFRAVEEGYNVICLIDGFFGNTPAVWHKEILFALKRGALVCGSSSIGALRAAELHSFGMIGFGWVYRAFRRGILADDDEVCVIHAVAEIDFAPLTEAMVNIRYSLRSMRRRGQISRDSERRIVLALKARHFSERTEDALSEAFQHEFADDGTAIFELYRTAKTDIKAMDAACMLAALGHLKGRAIDGSWELPVTNHWIQQFLLEGGDIPPLCRWHPRTPMNEVATRADS